VSHFLQRIDDIIFSKAAETIRAMKDSKELRERLAALAAGEHLPRCECVRIRHYNPRDWDNDGRCTSCGRVVTPQRKAAAKPGNIQPSGR
jgi:hypothetical protein